MRKQIYAAVTNRLKTLPEIKHTALWSEALLAYPQEELPYYTPAVFIEFEPIRWRHHTHGVREAEVIINIHVVTRTTIPSPTGEGAGGEVMVFLELPDKINAALHGLTIGSGGFRTAENGQMDALTSTTSTTDHNFDELMHTVESYSCHITDYSAQQGQAVSEPPKIKLNINP